MLQQGKFCRGKTRLKIIKIFVSGMTRNDNFAEWFSLAFGKSRSKIVAYLCAVMYTTSC